MKSVEQFKLFIFESRWQKQKNFPDNTVEELFVSFSVFFLVIYNWRTVCQFLLFVADLTSASLKVKKK